MTNILRREIPYRNMRHARMQQKLMLRQLHVPLMRIHDPLRTRLQRLFEQGDHLRGLARQFMRQLFIIADQVREVNIAEILAREDVGAQLVAVDVGAGEVEGEDEGAEFFCQLGPRGGGGVIEGGEDREGVGGAGVERHCCGV